MKVAVIHYELVSLGGGEQVCLSTVEALNKVGIIPDLFVNSMIERNKLDSVFNKKVDFNRIDLNLGAGFNFLRLYRGIFFKLQNLKLKEYDLVIDTSGVYANPLLLPKRYIIYVYNPTIHMLHMPSGETREGLFWKIYRAPYEILLRRSINEMRTKHMQVLAVSNFTGKKIEKHWGLKTETVYPPVSVQKYLCSEKREREGVISIGRFSPEKNHLWQLEIAKQLPELTFRICGSTMTPNFQSLYEQIRSKAEGMNLKNVEFYPNISQDKLIELTWRSRYYLHTMKNEDFGITVCEAIAGGCIPIVHNSGGPIEIVSDHELRYDTLQEAVQIFRSKEEKYPLNEVWRFLFEHIQSYKEEKFQERMLGLISA